LGETLCKKGKKKRRQTNEGYIKKMAVTNNRGPGTVCQKRALKGKEKRGIRKKKRNNYREYGEITQGRAGPRTFSITRRIRRKIYSRSRKKTQAFQTRLGTEKANKLTSSRRCLVKKNQVKTRRGEKKSISPETPWKREGPTPRLKWTSSRVRKSKFKAGGC